MQMVEGAEVRMKTGLSAPHTSHCLASGDMMISCMGDEKGDGKGDVTRCTSPSHVIRHALSRHT